MLSGPVQEDMNEKSNMFNKECIRHRINEIRISKRKKKKNTNWKIGKKKKDCKIEE